MKISKFGKHQTKFSYFYFPQIFPFHSQLHNPIVIQAQIIINHYY